MHISPHAPLHLLHRSPAGILATHLREPEGYPFPTMLPFVPDARHRPVILVSRLAEHTRNLQTDMRAGFLVVGSPDDHVLDGERVTLIGQFPGGEATPALVRRYLRYHPAAERYLALGDFSFRIMEVEKLRFIGGFGAMGWMDGGQLDELDPISDDEEIALTDYFDRHRQRPTALELAGVDRYGIDLKVDGARRRVIFGAPKTSAEALEEALAECIAAHGD